MNLPRLAFAVLASTVILNTSPLSAQSKSVQRYFTFSASMADSVRDAEHEQLIVEGLVGLKLRQQSTVGVLVAAFAGGGFSPPFFGSDLLCPIATET